MVRHQRLFVSEFVINVDEDSVLVGGGGGGGGPWSLGRNTYIQYMVPGQCSRMCVILDFHQNSPFEAPKSSPRT